jgi:hypothetical protein
VSNVDLAELIVPRRPLFLRAAAYMRLLLGALSLLMLLASGTSSSWAPQPVPISTRWAYALATAKKASTQAEIMPRSISTSRSSLRC